MKVLFVYTSVNVRSAGVHGEVAMQLGISSISALLKSRGHECELLLVTRPDFADIVDTRVAQFQPDVVAYTSVATQFPHIAAIAAQVSSKHPEIYQICGGPYATLAPQAALEQAGLDAVCVGEGEYPMLELIEALSRGQRPARIANLCFRGPGGQIETNAPRPFTQDLDALPLFDRELYAPYVDLGRYEHCIITTRGCPFNCSYCCNHAFKKLAAGRYVRSRSVGNVMAEVEQLRTSYPDMKYLHVEDEAVGLNRSMWDELLGELKRTGLSFGVNYRIGVTGPEFLDRLRDANFVRINVGIESGNEWIRANVLNRKYTNEQILATFSRARSLGMETKAYNLIGLPHETPERFEDTLRINQAARPDHPRLYIFYPYPGTALDTMCDELGLKRGNEGEAIRERDESILNLPGFSREQIMEYCNSWRRRTRPSGPARLWHRLRRSLAGLSVGRDASDATRH